MRNCAWEQIEHFTSTNEYEAFVRYLEDQVSSGSAEEVPVDPAYGPGLIFGGRWFKDRNSNEVWRLVPPDFPFRGLWMPVLERQQCNPLYLASMDSRAFAAVRRCEVERVLSFPSGKKALLIRVVPAGPGADFGLPGVLDNVVVTPSLEGYSVDPVNEYPCYVHIAGIRKGARISSGRIEQSDLISLARGELYESEEQALRYVGD